MDRGRDPVLLPPIGPHRRAVRFLLTGVVFTLVLVWLTAPGSIPHAEDVLCQDFVVAAMACMTRIPEALSRVREEQTRAGAEQDAFESFVSRIQTMDAGSPPAPPTPGQGRVLAADASTRTGLGLAPVREAYQETVMATPHYPEDYDESLFVNVTNEFSAELATAITKGGSLTPTLQQALVEASQTAATERESYITALEYERDALQDARRRLRTLMESITQMREQTSTPQSFTAHIDACGRVEALRADCATIIENRQAVLASWPQYKQHHLQDYLYRNQDWSYPILSDTLDCRAQIQVVEDEIVQAITHRP